VISNLNVSHVTAGSTAPYALTLPFPLLVILAIPLFKILPLTGLYLIFSEKLSSVNNEPSTTSPKLLGYSEAYVVVPIPIITHNDKIVPNTLFIILFIFNIS